MSYSFAGSGPGVQTRDGSSVELYGSMPYLDDLDGVRVLLTPGTSVLELGAGAGRLTRRMLEWGLIVSAVDNSPEMLARVPDDAVRVLSDIEDLRLGKTFDTVLLASCLINHPARLTRTSLARTARSHIAPHGQLLIERHDPIWLESAEVGLASTGKGVEIFVESVRRNDSLIEMTLRFEILDRAWHQSFCVVPLLDSEVEELLSEVGFKSFEWFGPKRRWVRAVAA